MKLLATHAFNCIVLMIKFGRTSCEDTSLALHCRTCLANYTGFKSCHISSQIIYSLGADTHTHMNMHTKFPFRINNKEPDMK